MNYTKKEKINQITEDTLVVGIDVAKARHVARFQDFRGIEFGNPIYFLNRESGFERFKRKCSEIAEEKNKKDIIIGLEPTGHYWLPLYRYFILSGYKVVTVDPHHVEKSKELDDHNPTKCDKKDAKVIAQLVKDGRYSEPNLPEEEYADLRVAMGHRKSLIETLNGIQNNIVRWLDMYFPEFTEVFKNWEGKAALCTLRHIPLPEEVRKKEPEEIVDIWKENGIKRGVSSKKAWDLKKCASRSIGMDTGKNMAKRQLEDLLEQYDKFKAQLSEIESDIKILLNKIPGAEEMLTIPGVGEITVAGFFAECGDLHKYNHPKQIIKLAGLNLMEHSSGKHKGETKITKRGRPELRALLFRVSLPLVRHNSEFRQIHEYYTTRPKNPLEKKQSLIAICCKLIKILYTLGTREIEYDGQKMINDIERPAEYKKSA